MPGASIVYLDSATLNAGDVDFGQLSNLGDLTLHLHTSPEETLERCQGAEVVLTNKVVLTREILTKCAESLRYVVVTATGTNNVDLEAAKELGIPVSNVSGYSTEGVAQHVMGMILNFATNMHRYFGEAKQWPESPMFTRLDYPMMELGGKRLGIVGLGTIGSRVAQLAQAFNMEVVALAREGSETVKEGIPRIGADLFFGGADFITLHCPLTPDNKGFINSATLGQMKPTAFLINTGRGPLINEADLITALKSGTIAGAALDVLSVEPPPADDPLINADLPNLLITPHCAWACRESRLRLLKSVVENVRCFLAGETLRNQVA